MTSIDFDKTDNTWRLIDNKLIQVCNDNNVDYYDYVGVFLNLLNKFNSLLSKKNTIEKLDFKNKLDVRAILNKRDISSKEIELLEAQKKVEKYEKKLFNWLDKTKTPYFFILNPYFLYGYFTDCYRYNKVFYTGIQNLETAEKYANYKINLNN